MKHPFPVTAIIALAVCASAQEKTAPISSIFHNERLKTQVIKDIPITGDINVRIVSGFWVSESKDPSKTLVFPQQVKLICTHGVSTCQELIITLAPTVGMVAIQDVL